MRSGLATSWMIVLLLCSMGNGAEPAAEPGASPSNEALLQQVLAELKAANQKLDKLNERVEALEEARDAAIELPNFGHFRANGPDVEALKKLELPENPTRAQVDDYIADIAKLTQKQTSFGTDDPQVAMLAKVGPDHLQALIDAMSRWGELDFYLSDAISRVCRVEHRPLVLENLRAHPDLVSVVVERGWEKEAREPLIEGLKARPDYLPGEWIEAVATLGDPATYPVLTDYLIHGSNRAWTYETISRLPGIELSDAVGEAWKRARIGRDDPWERMEMAKIAVQYGHEDALMTMIEQIDNEMFQHMGPWGDELRTNILLHIDFHGSNEEIKQWYKENRGRLRFDDEKKRFYVAGGMS